MRRARPAPYRGYRVSPVRRIEGWVPPRIGVRGDERGVQGDERGVQGDEGRVEGDERRGAGRRCRGRGMTLSSPANLGRVRAVSMSYGARYSVIPTALLCHAEHAHLSFRPRLFVIAMKTARTTPTPSYRGNPVPMVGRRGGHARHLRLPTGSQRPFFITSCGLNKAIVIPSEAEEPEPVADNSGPFLRPPPAFAASAHGRRGSWTTS